ncbi:MAG: TonB-dependent receptor [candidate division KSB1 bacterium]|nr:TonB-dependent receptor [candidate division KSB1 bacterium]
MSDYDNFYSQYTDALGDTVPAFILDKGISSNKFAAFVNYIVKPIVKLTTTLGIRADYFSYNKKSSVSPRFSFSYQLSALTSVNGSIGIYYQTLPLILLTQNENNKNLKNPLAIHYILGIDHLITENTKFTLEVYQKDYKNFPLDPTQPTLFLIDK